MTTMQQAERARRAQQEREALERHRMLCLKQMVDAVRAAGATCDDALTELNGTRTWIHIENQHSGGRDWFSAPNGKVFITMGLGDNVARFPEPKNGYGPKQAQRAIEWAQCEQRIIRERKEREERQRNADAEARRVTESLQGAAVDVYGTRGGNIKLSLICNPEQALKAIEALRAIGIKC